MPDDRAERLMVAILIFNGISADYGNNKIVLIRLDNGMGIRGRGICQKRDLYYKKVIICFFASAGG